MDWGGLVLGTHAMYGSCSPRKKERRVCRNAKFRHTLLSCIRVSKMQGAEMEDEGSVLKYMTKSEIEEQRSSLLIMTQRLVAGVKDPFSL